MVPLSNPLLTVAHAQRTSVPLLHRQGHGGGMLKLIGRSRYGDCVSSGRRARIVYSTTATAASSNHNGAHHSAKDAVRETKSVRLTNHRNHQNE